MKVRQVQGWILKNPERELKLTPHDGRVVRASDCGAVDLGLIPSRVKPITLKLVFSAFLFNAQHKGTESFLRVVGKSLV